MKKLVYVILFGILMIGAHAQEPEKNFETGKEWAEAVKKEITQIAPEDFHKLYSSAVINGDPGFILIDNPN